jgi:hypothetical protein
MTITVKILSTNSYSNTILTYLKPIPNTSSKGSSMVIYLFIYTLIGFALAYLIIPVEQSLFHKHFYPKAIIFILTWPISAIIYYFMLANL